MEKEEKKKNWMHEHGIEKAEFVKEAITVLSYNLGESRSVFLSQFAEFKKFSYDGFLQGGFAKMSRKWPKTAENRLKSIKIDLFRPKMT